MHRLVLSTLPLYFPEYNVAEIQTLRHVVPMERQDGQSILRTT